MKKHILIMALTFSVISLLMLPGMAGAASGTTTLSGIVGASITITCPDPISMPSLVPGNTIYSASQSITVTSNTNGWVLDVSDFNTNDTHGKLLKTDGTAMTSPLYIQGGAITEYKSLESSQILKNGGTPGTYIINDIIFRQTVPSTTSTGTYSITLTFTATPGS